MLDEKVTEYVYENCMFVIAIRFKHGKGLYCITFNFKPCRTILERW